MNLYCQYCDLDQTISDLDQSTIICGNCGRALTAATDMSVRSDALDCRQRSNADELNDGRAPDSDPIRIGSLRIDSLLGSGSFGSVYSAFDENLERIVAVKIPRRRRLATQAAEDFLAEAKMLAKLEHNHIVSVYDARVDEATGIPLIVMRWVDGWTLGQYARAHDLYPQQCWNLVSQLADALDYAHQHGVIHRDLKPTNILIDKQGNPYITDFGLAIQVDSEHDGRQVAGTLAYMSPEAGPR